MAPMALALILGWCLVAASRAQHLPRPSLCLHPSQGVSLGDTVTLRCHLPQPAIRVQLCQDQYLTSCMHKQHVQDVADFFITTKREHAGTYRCQYWALQTSETSEKSDPVELVLTDHTFPPPEISLSPGGQVRTGTNITIRCWNKDLGATFLLHKDGCSAPVQRQNPDGGGMATFTLLGVTPADAGTYRCSYHIKGYFPLMSSPLGNSVSLEVTSTPANPGAPPRRPEAVQLQVRPSDSESLTYVELQAEPPSTRPPAPHASPQPYVIYADVSTGRPC